MKNTTPPTDENEELQKLLEPSTTAPNPVAPPPIPYVFHGSVKRYLSQLGTIRPILAVLLSLILWLRFGFVAWVAIFPPLFVLGFVTLFFLARRTVTADAEGVTLRRFFGNKRVIKYSEIESVKVFLYFVDTSLGASARYSIATKSGKQFPISLQAFYWNAEDLQKLAALLETKTKVEYYSDVTITYVGIKNNFPLHTTYVERYPVRVFWIILVAALAVCVVAALFMTFVW